MTKEKNHRLLLITIDGPAGSGKSTVARELSNRLSYMYLDTGALYRAVAWQVLGSGISTDDEETIVCLCMKNSIYLKHEKNLMRIIVDGRDISDELRTENLGMLASKISAFKQVREVLLPIQREAGSRGGLVAEGRDMGSVVFPSADVKFYLDAASRERSMRRYKELLSRHGSADYEAVQKDLSARDQQDCSRELAPLRIPENAVVVDTTVMNPQEVVEYMLLEIEKVIPLLSLRGTK
ncbi:MAG: (d)CMP kinase [Syntrophales bacterium]